MNFIITSEQDEMFWYLTADSVEEDVNFSYQPHEARCYYRYEDALNEMRSNVALCTPDYWIQPTDAFFEDATVPIEMKTLWHDLHPDRARQARSENSIPQYVIDDGLGDSNGLKGASCHLVISGRKFEIREPCMLAVPYGISHKTAFSLPRSVIDYLVKASPLLTLIFDIRTQGFNSLRAATGAEVIRLVTERKAPLHEVTVPKNDLFANKPSEFESFYIFDALWFTKVNEVLD